MSAINRSGREDTSAGRATAGRSDSVEFGRILPVPDTGTLRGGPLACARTFVQNERTQRILAGLMVAMVRHSELRIAARHALGGPFTALFHQAITRAVDRGDVPASADTEAISEMFPALAFHRGAALGLPVDEKFVVRVVDGLLLPLLR